MYPEDALIKAEQLALLSHDKYSRCMRNVSSLQNSHNNYQKTKKVRDSEGGGGGGDASMKTGVPWGRTTLLSIVF